ncbi:ATP-binding cassette domain-containing protein [Niallia sp. Krafla_26]|uniref:ATP-binding cassette domain-containing protein n=1 Tax=Niallia sp. Krafla_26 TaxID=3064703 RepID=UPI003D16D6A2
MTVIQCQELTKVYKRKPVLNDVSFTIEENTITGLLGRNGAGKTTLLKIIAGYIKGTSGQITVYSEVPFNSLSVSLSSIFVDDEMSFPAALQLGEILEVAASFYPNWDTSLAQKLFNYFSFDPSDYHNRLSKGKTSTFNSIIGLASRCPLTIFDEPTTGMDEGVRKDFYRALLKDYIAYPRTIILSSHQIDEIEDILENVLLLKNGQVYFHIPMSGFKEWGIGIKGNSETVERIIKNREILYKNRIGTHTTYAVLKNDLTQEDRQEAYLSGVEIVPVKVSDLFIYLTNEKKGGIDNVFTNN